MRFSIGRWVGLVTAAESVGFLIPASALALTTIVDFPPWAAWITVVVFGAGEGALLGLGQALALRPTVLAVPVLRWVAATAVAASFAWSLGMLPSTLDDSGVDVDFGHPMVWVVMGVGGIALLLSIPTAQYLVLRGRVSGAAWWIPVNVAAWSVGLMFTFLPSPFVDETTPGWVMAVAFAGAGVCMAATVATVTGLWWRRRDRVLSSANQTQGSETCSNLGA